MKYMPTGDNNTTVGMAVGAGAVANQIADRLSDALINLVHAPLTPDNHVWVATTLVAPIISGLFLWYHRLTALPPPPTKELTP